MAATSLPSDVWKDIFSYLDVQSVCLAREVCKTWDFIIKDMLKSNKLWKNSCMRDIPENVLKEMLWFKDPSTCDDKTDYRSIYKQWCQTRMVKMTPHSRHKIHHFYPNPVSCMGMSGSFVLTGHFSGLLCIWNKYNGKLEQSCICHTLFIQDLAFVNLENIGSYPSGSYYSFAHHHVITVSRDHYINVISLLEPMGSPNSIIRLKHHVAALVKVIVFGDTFAVRIRGNALSLWKMEIEHKPEIHLKVSLIRAITGPPDPMISFGLFNNEVQCITNGGKFKVFRPDEDDWIEKKDFNEPNTHENTISVNQAFVYRGRTAIILTTDGVLIISVGEEHKRSNIQNILRTEIVSVSFYGRILSFGGENGRLFLYHVSSEYDLLKVDFSRPDLTLPLMEDPIIFIDISYQNDSPVVAVSSVYHIQIINWQWPSSWHKIGNKRKLSLSDV